MPGRHGPPAHRDSLLPAAQDDPPRRVVERGGRRWGWGKTAAKLGKVSGPPTWSTGRRSTVSARWPRRRRGTRRRGPAPAHRSCPATSYSYLARVATGRSRRSRRSSARRYATPGGLFRWANRIAYRGGRNRSALAKLARVPVPLRWRLTDGPWFDNAIDRRTVRTRCASGDAAGRRTLAEMGAQITAGRKGQASRAPGKFSGDDRN